MPWAFAGALALVAAVEVAVRLAPPAALIPYGLGTLEHEAVASYLAAVGAADVAFVGSSMTRAGVVAPQVRARLARVGGHRPYVANYGALGGTAAEMLAAVRYMLRAGAAPRTLLLLEVSPRQLRARPLGASDVVAYWGLHDWWRAWRAGAPAAQGALPEVLRNVIGEHYRTFRYRQRFVQWWEERVLGDATVPAPMAGARSDRGRSASLARLPRAQRARRLAQWSAMNTIATFALDDRLVADFERTLALCRAHGVPVALYEVPISDDARRALPPGVYPQFQRVVGTLARRYGVPLWTLERLGFVARDRDFADFGHLNGIGARRYTHALLEHVLLPRWARRPPDLLPAGARGASSGA